MVQRVIRMTALSTDHTGVKEIKQEIGVLKSKQNNVVMPWLSQKGIAMKCLDFSCCISVGSKGENRKP